MVLRMVIHCQNITFITCHMHAVLLCTLTKLAGIFGSAALMVALSMSIMQGKDKSAASGRQAASACNSTLRSWP